MAEVVVEVDVGAPVQATWALLTDWEQHSTWMIGTEVRGTHRDGRGVGGRLEAFTGLGPVGFLDTMEITGWEPPYRCLVRHTGRVVRGAGAFEVLPRPEGSRIVWSEWLELPLGRLGQLGFLAVRPAVVLPLRLSLQRLARAVERRQAATG